MIRPRQLLRLSYINIVLLRHGLDEVILATHLLRPLRFLSYLIPWRWFRRNTMSRGARLRRTLEDLGPIFVKFGQILSTRRDLLPGDIADELAYLQDRVPPFPGAVAKTIVEKAYGHPLEQVFASFDELPLASASIAQVHAATLLDGREVVVKVVRPGISNVIQRDLELMYTVAGLAERYWSQGRRLHPREVVAEFEKTVYDELDLLRESANASQLRRNFKDSPLLYVPDVYWPLVRRNVTVMERIYGLPVSDMDALREHGIDLRKLAERGVEIFFTQVFRDSFFHADMHPGNIFVNPRLPDEPQYIAVDFGIIGTLNPTDHRYLAENFLAFFHRDYRRVAELHVESGWVPANTRVDEFESAMRTVCEPIFERPLKDISFGALLLRLFQTAGRFNMEVQPQLVLLQKTLLNIEGLGRQLYPELDLWQTAKPFMEEWMKNQVGGRSVLRRLRERLPDWGELVPELPTKLVQALEGMSDTRRGLHEQRLELMKMREEMRNEGQRRYLAYVGIALLIVAFGLTRLPGFSLDVAWQSLSVGAVGGIAFLLLIAGWLRG